MREPSVPEPPSVQPTVSTSTLSMLQPSAVVIPSIRLTSLSICRSRFLRLSSPKIHCAVRVMLFSALLPDSSVTEIVSVPALSSVEPLLIAVPAFVPASANDRTTVHLSAADLSSVQIAASVPPMESLPASSATILPP